METKIHYEESVESTLAIDQLWEKRVRVNTGKEVQIYYEGNKMQTQGP